MTKLEATYPTKEHQTAANAFVEFFTSNYKINAVLLVHSCARGKATRDSCLDIITLAKPDSSSSQFNELEAGWLEFEKSNPDIQALYKVGKYSVVNPDFITGVFNPLEQDESGGPNDFEVQVGNFLAYSVPLWQGSDYYSQLKKNGCPITMKSYASNAWSGCDGSASTTCITFHSTANASCISSPLTDFTTPIRNSCKLCLSLAIPIRLPTTNGFMNRSWRFWVCPSYMSD
jgi:predicted nucleotidyltransferase